MQVDDLTGFGGFSPAECGVVLFRTVGFFALAPGTGGVEFGEFSDTGIGSRGVVL